VTKRDCVNHADKRMGTALRKVVKEKKLGGQGVGRLTNVKASKIQLYYGRAIRGNLNSVEQMRNAIWASFFHSISTNESPHHARCPQGPESWCIFNKAEALGLPVPDHGPNTLSTWMKPEVGGQVIGIYERMSDDNLLLRMIAGGTQNANESFNSLIWLYTPKTSWFGYTRVLSAVQSAVIRFNTGASAMTQKLRCLGIQATEAQMACSIVADNVRIKKAEIKSDKKEQDRRRMRQQANQRATAQLEDEEGLQYGVGEF
jgi:hypothetical protein